MATKKIFVAMSDTEEKNIFPHDPKTWLVASPERSLTETALQKMLNNEDIAGSKYSGAWIEELDVQVELLDSILSYQECYWVNSEEEIAPW